MKIRTLVIAASAVLAVASSQSIFAQCVTPFEEGNWVNIDAATHGITRINVTFTCQDQVLNGQPYPPGAPFHLHLFGKCTPSDCNWGVADGHPVTIGSTRWIYSFYDQGFAKRYVYIKPSTLFPGDLYMWMYTDFVDPSRGDYVLTNWFHK
jgi:hypothetical protein